MPTAKWRVLSRLYSPSQNRYYERGEMIALDGEISQILLEKRCITPWVDLPRGEGREAAPATEPVLDWESSITDGFTEKVIVSGEVTSQVEEDIDDTDDE
jgi:hypothetical protein